MPQQPRALVKHIRDIREAPEYILGEAPRYNAVLFRSPETISLARAFSYETHYKQIEETDNGFACVHWAQYDTPDTLFHLHSNGIRGRLASTQTRETLKPFLSGISAIVRPAFAGYDISTSFINRASPKGGNDHCDEKFDWVANMTLGAGLPRTQWRNGAAYFSGAEGSILICNGAFSHRTPPYDKDRAVLSVLGLKRA